MKPNKLELNSVDGTQLNLEALYQIAPSCFTEVKNDKTGELRHVVNFKTLRQLLGDNAVEDADEMYQFTWPGKQEARREAARPTTKTLRPVIEDSVDWDNTQNLYIEGDNLEVLKLLQKSYMGKVKMIYIDPPYNTGNDFVYDDDFAVSQDDYDLFAGDVDELGNRYRKNTDSNARFHSDWCSMIYSRLMVARSLLAEDGVIFISIDDHEQKNIRNICDEIFGESNFVSNFIWEKRLNRENRKEVSSRHDYILCYIKQKSEQQRSLLLLPMNEKALSNYGNPDNDPRGLWKSDPAHAQAGHGTKSQFYTLTAPNGKKHDLPSGRCWLYTEPVMNEAIKENRIWFGKDGNGVPRIKTYLNAKERGLTPESLLFAKDVSTNEIAKNELKRLFDGIAVFETPKPVELLKYFAILASKSEDIILDFFSGSSATAHAVMQLNAEDSGNRKYIMVQLPEETPEDSEARKAGYNTIPEIAKERIRRAGKKIKEEFPLTTQNLDTGFRVFRLADSNFEEVKKAPGEYDQAQLELFLNNVKSDRTDLDLLFGAMLSWGVQLSLPMASEEVDGKMIYSVNDGDLVACFADDITENIVKAMAEKQPLRVLFSDSCFTRDDAKINVFETLKQLLDWSEEEAMKNIKVI
ncbi:site-specific DNA-methyltransferase [Bacteroides caecigallinarum]|uniref:site-specific DNA-methyltransferase n=1 Tax=Bacteroides caecigallinarum TaxID=1411144 RepID=UPI00195790FE|nr:site-specific DNA-methyltransferase [Bacteroides caecigallinarum]MBM6890441.1 site-specific DNA-methyltransferase [Bacteroides caecigallinarum]